MSEPAGLPKNVATMGNGGNGRDEIRITGPAGITASLRGPFAVLLLVLMGGFVLLAAILREDAQFRMAEHTKILDAQNGLACMLAIPQELRPDAIRNPLGICHYAAAIFPAAPERRGK